jgi:putative hydrolase of the HAD superfamily
MDLLSNVSGTDLNIIRDKWSSDYERRITGYDSSVLDYLTDFFNNMDVKVGKEDLNSIHDEYRELTQELMIFFDDVEPTLRMLRKNGMKIGLLTNCNSFVPPLFKDSDIASSFDTMVFSSVEGLRKPDPDLFRYGCERLSILPSKCSFIGDGDNDELRVAREMGMFSIRIERGKIAGDHMIEPCDQWDPTVSTFLDLRDLLLDIRKNRSS